MLGIAHYRERRHHFDLTWGKGPLVQQMKEYFTREYPVLPNATKILLIDDPFTENEWTPVSLLQLIYRNPDLAVDRTKFRDQLPVIAKTHFDLVISYRGECYRRDSSDIH